MQVDDQAVDDNAEQPESIGARIYPFNMISAAERRAIQVLMEGNSGLKREQFAMNSWGFPIVPIPRPRYANGFVRMAPSNVSDEFLGHPIYWIDPNLTRFDPTEESEESWSIRMFYLILAMGYWTEDLKWVNYPYTNDLDYTVEDVDLYHMDYNPECNFDLLDLLTEESLVVPMEKVTLNHQVAMDTCSRMLNKSAKEFQSHQKKAIKIAYSLLGKRFRQPQTEPDDGLGAWTTVILPVMESAVTRYQERVPDRYSSDPISDLLDPTTRIFASFEKMMSQIDQIIATLSIPVIRSNETSSNVYAQIITYMGIATTQSRQRHDEHSLRHKVEIAFGTEREPRALRKIVEECYEVYSDAWKRLRLATINYERMVNGLGPFPSHEILVGHLVESQAKNKERFDPNIISRSG